MIVTTVPALSWNSVKTQNLARSGLVQQYTHCWAEGLRGECLGLPQLEVILWVLPPSIRRLEWVLICCKYSPSVDEWGAVCNLQSRRPSHLKIKPFRQPANVFFMMAALTSAHAVLIVALRFHARSLQPYARPSFRRKDCARYPESENDLPLMSLYQDHIYLFICIYIYILYVNAYVCMQIFLREPDAH